MTKFTVTTAEAVAFGATMFGSACINNLFVTYYMDLFCGVVSVSSTWFFVGQVVFMMWNALNDFVFGWFSDRGASRGGGAGAGGGSDPPLHPVHSRARAIRVGGFVWGVAFLLIWYPPGDAAPDFWKGLHFALSLCFYDGMLSYVEVNHSALLAEICTSSHGRATCNMYSAVFAVLGSASSYFGHVYWNGPDLAAFRKVCFAVSVLSVLSFEFTAAVISKHAPELEPVLDLRQDANDEGANDGNSDDAGTSGRGSTSKSIVTADGVAGVVAGEARIIAPRADAQSAVHSRLGVDRRVVAAPGVDDADAVVSVVNRTRSLKHFILQVCHQRNFVIFVGIQCLQNFDCTFEKNFFHVFLRSFAADEVSKSAQGVILSASFIVPWLGMVLITPVIQRYGVYVCVQNIFRLRLLLALISVGIVHHSPWVGCMCLLVNRVTSESICRLCPLVISHLIDEDKYLHHKLRDRAAVRSASIVGASQVLGKLSQSLAPMLGYVFVEFGDTEKTVGADATGMGGKGYPDDPLMVSDDDLVQEDAASAEALVDTAAAEVGTLSATESASLLYGTVVVVVTLQLLFWGSFGVKGRYLARIKQFINGESGGGAKGVAVV